MTHFYPGTDIEIKLFDAVKMKPWWSKQEVLGVITQLNLEMSKTEGCKGLTVNLTFEYGREELQVPIDSLTYDLHDCACLIDLWEENGRRIIRRRSSLNFIARFLKKYQGSVLLPGNSVLYIYKMYHPQWDSQTLDLNESIDIFKCVNDLFKDFAKRQRSLLISGTPQQIEKALVKFIRKNRKETYEYMRNNNMGHLINL